MIKGSGTRMHTYPKLRLSPVREHSGALQRHQVTIITQEFVFVLVVLCSTTTPRPTRVLCAAHLLLVVTKPATGLTIR
jgi:hypothetical protein